MPVYGVPLCLLLDASFFDCLSTTPLSYPTQPSLKRRIAKIPCTEKQKYERKL